FILIGWIYERRKTWQVNQLRGLQWSAPVLAGIFTLFVMASIGLPGLNGFVGEFLILSGTFLVHRWWAIAATIGVVLAAVYLLWMYQQVFHGKPDAESEKMRDLGWHERLIMVPLIVIIVFLGVYPKPVLDRITPSVNQLLAHVDQVTHTQQPPAATGRIAASSANNAGTGGQP
ncbi:MAG TPA: proton-conducting transporter membrane subunit, partial [Acidimicrobiales bacterium]|nr:proton-conducting transporter membrane subunit [Acidimicrobiales bacterium]